MVGGKTSRKCLLPEIWRCQEGMSQWDSPHGTLDLNPNQIGGLDRKTTLPPQSLIWAACCAAWKCSGTMREIQSSNAICVLCVLCGTQRKTTLNTDRGSRSCESGFSAYVENHYVINFLSNVYRLRSVQDTFFYSSNMQFHQDSHFNKNQEMWETCSSNPYNLAKIQLFLYTPT